MSKILNEVLQANEAYAKDFGDKADLPMPPGRRFAVLTCMDARLDPAQFAGFVEGDAHVIRNAGGRASDDAIRSLVISYKLLGTREWFVVHHSDCGMLTFTGDVIGDLLAENLSPATIDENGWKNTGDGTDGSHEGKFIQWLEFSDLPQSVLEDVERIRNHPLVPKDIAIYGYIFDVKTGKLIEVEAATRAGAATA